MIPISSRCILILSSHLRLGRPKGLFPVGLPGKILKAATTLLPTKQEHKVQLTRVSTLEVVINFHEIKRTAPLEDTYLFTPVF